MELVVFSDTHSKHEQIELPDGDILIFGGDMSLVGSVSDCVGFIKWFKKQPHKHKVFIAGNHDWVFDVDSEHREMLLSYSDGCHYLENEIIEIEGITIYGSPYTPRIKDWANKRYGTDILNTIPDKVDIIITHTPIYQTLDLTKNSVNAGCKQLKEKLSTVDYKLHICGHIHEAYGYTSVDNKWYVNASFYNSNGIYNKPIIFNTNSFN